MLSVLLRGSCCTLVVVVTCVDAGAMQLDRWTAHTSARNVVAVDVSDDAVWAASTGGIFGYYAADGMIERYTVTDGLHDIDTRAIAWDARQGVVWVGYVDGVLDRLDVETGQVRTFYDIYRNMRFPSLQIHRLRTLGDTLLVATSFGLVVFEGDEVRDSYSTIGSFTPSIAVRDVMAATIPDGRPGLWLATDEGVAFASLDAANLKDPHAWTVERVSFDSGEVFSIARFNGETYVGKDTGLFRRNADGTYVRVGPTTIRVRDMAPMEDRLLVIDRFKLYAMFASGGSILQAEGYLGLNAVVSGPDGSVWIGDSESGLNRYSRPIGNDRPDLLTGEIYPSGPFHSPFGDLAVDSEGALWAAAVDQVIGGGFYRYRGEDGWTNYTARFTPELVGKGSIRAIHADAEGTVWATSIGSGIVQLAADGVVTLYDQGNSTLLPAAGESEYILPGGIATEKDGTLWVTNTSAVKPLHVRQTDGTWTSLPAPSCQGLIPTTALGPVFVDSFDLKWITVLERGNFRISDGILVLDTGSDPTDPSDDDCRYFGVVGTGGRGLPSTRITTVTEDHSGRIWIGTEDGPAVFLASSIAATDNSLAASWPQWAPGGPSTFVLQGLTINDIAADPSGGLWFGTDEGAYLIRYESGYRTVHRFTAEETPLFSDIVSAIAVDGLSGRVYFGTDKGLVSWRGDAINPAEAKRDLFVYPNPVQIEGTATPDIYIDGLVSETEIRIVTVHGELVKTFSARGGRARWDGRDDRQQLVPSGVYLVVAVGQRGEGVAFGKVAVIQ